jgi:hypothetical protein
MAAMTHSENDDFPGFLADAVRDPVRPPPSTPDALKTASEGSAHALRALPEWSGEEIDHCEASWAWAEVAGGMRFAIATLSPDAW